MADQKTTPELTPEQKQELVQARTARQVLPPFELRPFTKGQQVTLAMLRKLTEMPIPNANLGIRQLNKQHVEALKIAYQQGDTIPPLRLANSTHGVILVAGYHRVQAMRDALLEKIGAESEADVDKEELQRLLNETFVQYKPVVAKDAQELVQIAFLDNLTHGLPPTAENRSRFALYLIAEAEKNGQKMTQQEAADIVHVSRVAIARQIMRDKGTVGITKRSILPADYVAEPEAQEVMQEVQQEAADKKKQADPLQDATLSLFRNLRSIHAEMTSHEISPDEIVDYMEDIASNKLTGFNVDRFAFESIVASLTTLFKQ